MRFVAGGVALVGLVALSGVVEGENQATIKWMAVNDCTKRQKACVTEMNKATPKTVTNAKLEEIVKSMDTCWNKAAADDKKDGKGKAPPKGSEGGKVGKDADKNKVCRISATGKIVIDTQLCLQKMIELTPLNPLVGYAVVKKVTFPKDVPCLKAKAKNSSIMATVFTVSKTAPWKYTCPVTPGPTSAQIPYKVLGPRGIERTPVNATMDGVQGLTYLTGMPSIIGGCPYNAATDGKYTIEFNAAPAKVAAATAAAAALFLATVF